MVAVLVALLTMSVGVWQGRGAWKAPPALDYAALTRSAYLVYDCEKEDGLAHTPPEVWLGRISIRAVALPRWAFECLRLKIEQPTQRWLFRSTWESRGSGTGRTDLPRTAKFSNLDELAEFVALLGKEPLVSVSCDGTLVDLKSFLSGFDATDRRVVVANVVNAFCLCLMPVVVIAAIRGWLAARALGRVKRGNCPSCDYPLPGDGKCPECGMVVV